MNSDRRVFLKTLGAATAGMMLTAVRTDDAAAEVMSDQHFIFCYFSGGWDVLMSIDPREWSGSYRNITLGWENVDWTGSAAIPAARLQALQQQEGRVDPAGSHINFGPLFDSIFRDSPENAALYQRGSVIRGISMDTLTHEVGRRYFITGKMPAGTRAVGSSIPALMLSQLDQRSLPPLPNLAVRIEAYAEDVPFYANPARITTNTDLQRLLARDSNALSGLMAEGLRDYRHNAPFDDPAQLNRHGLLTLIRASQEDAEALVSSGLNSLFSTTALRAAGAGFDTALRGELNAAIAYQAMTNGLAHCASIELASGLDTHFDDWQDAQPSRQLAGWRALAKLVRSLETTPYKNTGDSWLDHTTVVCFSEFARTARINSRGGRDHNLVNAAYVIGACAPHNKVIGASDPDSMNPMAIHRETGALNAPAASSVILTPRIVYASLLKNAGFNTDELRNVEVDALRHK
jgi:uncharacterized protein (DUF1501 family)